MTLPIESLRDEETILPGPTLRFGLTGQFVEGAAVVLRWIVRSWFQADGANRLAPNATVYLPDLENATGDERTEERWRVALVRCAKTAAIGYLASIAVDVRLEDRTWAVTASVVLIDGSQHRLAVELSAAGPVVKFGGSP